MGTVKTRIASSLGPERAREIYCEIAESVFRQARRVPTVTLRFSPDDAHAEIRSWCDSPSWFFIGQGDGDMGARLVGAFDDMFRLGAERVVLVGTDSPEITTRDFSDAFAALHHADLVLGPAADGGYWLVGLRKPQPALFSGIRWSSSSVLENTLAVARSLSLSVQQLRVLHDIDTAEDWDRYQERKGKA